MNKQYVEDCIYVKSGKNRRDKIYRYYTRVFVPHHMLGSMPLGYMVMFALKVLGIEVPII